MSQPFIIAEIGSNWNTQEDCFTSILAAKVNGADAAKFQLYDSDALYGREGEVRGTLPPEWIPHLKSFCDRVGIEFMCTAFSCELLERIDPYVKRHKVASAELSHVRLLDLLDHIGKPVLLSTGASGVMDIHQAIEHLGGVELTLLYCVAAYPAHDIDLRIIPLMRETFRKPVGFSDHSQDVLEIPSRAAELGAVVIEKHFQAVEGQFPDSGHSLNPRQFKRMVDRIRNRLPARLGYSSEENEMVSTHNRRLMAIQDIRPGEIFQEDINMGIYRSRSPVSQALSPFRIEEVVGKPSKNLILKGQGIHSEDIG